MNGITVIGFLSVLWRNSGVRPDDLHHRRRPVRIPTDFRVHICAPQILISHRTLRSAPIRRRHARSAGETIELPMNLGTSPLLTAESEERARAAQLACKPGRGEKNQLLRNTKIRSAVWTLRHHEGPSSNNNSQASSLELELEVRIHSPRLPERVCSGKWTRKPGAPHVNSVRANKTSVPSRSDVNNQHKSGTLNGRTAVWGKGRQAERMACRRIECVRACI